MEDIRNELLHRTDEVVRRIDQEIVGEDIMFLLNRCVDNSKECGQNDDEILTFTRILLEICWEKMNTGYWKDVNISWRYVYSVTSIIRALVLPDPKESLIVCDKGLLMGAPILDNILARLASCIHKSLRKPTYNLEACCSSEKTTCERKTDGPDGKIMHKIKQKCGISLMDFITNYLSNQQPVVITNAATHWPATSKWDVSYIQRVAGYRTVPIEIGSKYTDDTWSQSLMTINEFVHKFLVDQTGPVGYLAQHQLFDQILELKDDICIPEYCLSDSSEDDIDINAWFGPSNTVSPLHYDPRNNILTQVFGSKYVRLYSPEESDKLYHHDGRMLVNTSQVDVESPNDEKFPLFRQAVYQECILEPGQMLFIPKKWWHFVKSLENSFSISFWFGQSD